jgi:nitrous oxidase accessory protein NosD
MQPAVRQSAWFAALWAVVGALVTGCAAPAEGAVRKADPATIKEVLDRARAGDVIVLAPGDYPAVSFSRRTFDKPVVIEAGTATLNGFSASHLEGLEIRGGVFHLPPAVVKPSNGRLNYGFGLRFDSVKNIRLTNLSVSGPGAAPGVIDGPYGEGSGVLFNGGEDVEVSNSRFVGLKNGIAMANVKGFRFADNKFAGLRSDGMSIGTSWNGVIEGNDCRDTRIRDLEHPDCIQLWSRATSPPTSDIVIRKNRAEGRTQGILMSNKMRNGVNDGGFDRIVIEDNDLYVGFPNAIALVEARDSVVRNNRISTYPDAQYASRLNLKGDIKQCGNVIGAGPSQKKSAEQPC